MAWHHRTLCRRLDMLAAGAIKRLMVFAPPRHGKSELASRRFPAYYLGRNPDDEVVMTSYAAALANRMNRNVQAIITSNLYQQLFPGVRLQAGRVLGGMKAKRAQDFFEIPGHLGSLRSAGVGGGISGMGFKLGIIDDPIKDAEEALSMTIRDGVWDWYTSTFLTRQAPEAAIMLIQTRWNEDDLAGRLLKEQAAGGDQWDVISFPAISEAPLSPYDQRTAAGMPLWPERFDLPWLEKMHRALGTFWWDALYRQNPTPEGGALFKSSWFGKYGQNGDRFQVAVRPPRAPYEVNISDCTFMAAVDPASSMKDNADYTAIVTGALTPQNDLLLIDVFRDRISIEEIPKKMLEIAQRYPIQWYVFEDNGFQIAVVQAARRISGMIPIREVSHRGRDKVVRATPAIIKAEAQEIFLPPEKHWVQGFLEEAERFRGEDEKNDQIDAFAYLVNQCPRNIDSDQCRGEIADRVRVTERAATAVRRNLWGRK
jgi:predicted phage terminase large subunit-like protein